MTWALATIAALLIAYATVSRRLEGLNVSGAMFFTTAGLLVGLLGNALFGAWWLDPTVGLLIAAVAVKEGLEAWRGEGCACVAGPLPLVETAPRDAGCCDDRQ